MLELVGLSKSFGGLRAVNELSFNLPAGGIFGLIGPNGSGKTTAINLITGLYVPTSGRIMLEGSDIGGKSAYSIAREGVARTFQNMRLFKELTVEENVRAFQTARIGGAYNWFRTGRKVAAELDEKVDGLLQLLNLTGLRRELAGSLSLGAQKRLEIARALAIEPKLLLLDEPAGGMSHQEIESLGELMRSLVSKSLTIMLIEHNMRFVMSICERIAVINFGQLITVGAPQEIRANPAVIEAYLGND